MPLTPGGTNEPEPGDLLFHLRRGEEHQREGRLEEAEAEFRRAIELAPEDQRAGFLRDAAVPALDRAVEPSASV